MTRLKKKRKKGVSKENSFQPEGEDDRRVMEKKKKKGGKKFFEILTMGRKYPWNNIPPKLTRSSLVRTFNYFLYLGSPSCVSSSQQKKGEKKIKTTPQCSSNFKFRAIFSLDHALATIFDTSIVFRYP